jgi:hypothetical protein
MESQKTKKVLDKPCGFEAKLPDKKTFLANAERRLR